VNVRAAGGPPQAEFDPWVLAGEHRGPRKGRAGRADAGETGQKIEREESSVTPSRAHPNTLVLRHVGDGPDFRALNVHLSAAATGVTFHLGPPSVNTCRAMNTF
jgi:hypothetical protein